MDKDKLKKYSRILTQLIKERHKIEKPHFPSVRAEMVIDRKHHHYILMYVGWEKSTFAYYAVVHFDIIEDKIWIQQNNTDEEGLIEEMLKKGIRSDEIVLAFLPPEMRKYSGFAVA
ncbi:MAG: XisI protein [Bacteroidia bacterium]